MSHRDPPPSEFYIFPETQGNMLEEKNAYLDSALRCEGASDNEISHLKWISQKENMWHKLLYKAQIEKWVAEHDKLSGKK
jgi:hypothetical protein|tara:strand:- start:234 stop:473 length:240 start_codon:yes stop_codon:yes gene_type:complete